MSFLHNLFKYIPDKEYIQLMYFKHFGEFVNFKDPKTFNEKMQWLKLYDFKPNYIKMVDKIEAKKYVQSIIGEEYIIPNIGIWDNPYEIDFNKLPNEFVLKWNHDSGSIIICKDKQRFDIKKAISKLEVYRKHNGYFYGRERPYKYIKPKIIAEKYINDEQREEPPDYKFFCFNGKVKYILVCTDRSTELKETFFDTNWNKASFKRPNFEIDNSVPKPRKYMKMIELAEKLSKDFSFLRVDFYETNGKIFFGELTFFPASGFAKFEPEEWDYKLGELITLPIKKY